MYCDIKVWAKMYIIHVHNCVLIIIADCKDLIKCKYSGQAVEQTLISVCLLVVAAVVSHIFIGSVDGGMEQTRQVPSYSPGQAALPSRGGEQQEKELDGNLRVFCTGGMQPCSGHCREGHGSGMAGGAPWGRPAAGGTELPSHGGKRGHTAVQEMPK